MGRRVHEDETMLLGELLVTAGLHLAGFLGFFRLLDVSGIRSDRGNPPPRH